MPDAAEMLPEPDAGPCVLGQFHDDFEDGATAPLWRTYADRPASTQELDGFFVITLANNQSGSRYAGYTSVVLADARSQWLETELVQVPTQVLGTNAYFKLEQPDDFTINVMFLIEDDQLVMRRESPDTLVEQVVPYDALEHRFLAFETTSDTVSFFTSSDGVTWTNQLDVTAPFPLAETSVALGAGTWRAAPSPGNAVFARVGQGAGQGCP